ncbi:carbamoyl phosphate synthase small subunit [Thermotoga maritima MSB8]|uniref:Carbamoyl phosphate synthase small chain n=1 Tax=Thermotoga maritima (strain ATCC 43589 / DSM 3109 / JCM 10099 / NBRC 100826 / MSB8) TaxID=243274 RepID=CARA_THEMA|nr:glutamine-hydrolyzing carbamoyl-phosphate synthase small subunit [Thermotoga maritima]Q9WZ28.1 RecName: Full=Carbamoyl phosphate synthase small chain; AltName: Full=Carbamoyl phosphate synthetase glutamine chain [Thermotoga maritima MSB8]AAD35643.1 carbamoyl-phosphate synthetase, small subunit [Thermotoga maritima MSB8]AGL49480.1 Carbamoyl-phosphate synthase small chain [Thermotoga maritima MSB8]AHD17686.1 carbamoyl phosphate synthase small subunit [Thermotoga maritima MSB8]AKE26480.1 carba
MSKKALLALEDGSFFFGQSLGAEGETFGELVFNTGMTGYQEVLTDPSYTGQIVVMTYPEIGIYGVNDEDVESDGIKVAGFVVYRSVDTPSNWRATMSFPDYLKKYNIVAIEGVDTRALTRKIRVKGAMKGAISTVDLDPDSLVKRVKESPSIVGRDLAGLVSPKEVIVENPEGDFSVVVLDSGVKWGILRDLKRVGAKVMRVPYSVDIDDIKKLNPDGVLISNGPGDPAALLKTIRLIKDLLKEEIPLAGICLGHQLLGLAVGGRTYKMKFGHRGINHPVKDLRTGRVLITTHNHGFAVDPKSFGLPELGSEDQDANVLTKNLQKISVLEGISPQGIKVEITHISLNDGTMEGMRLVDYPAFSVQYHPEASPGPHDAKYFFEEFKRLIKEVR